MSKPQSIAWIVLLGVGAMSAIGCAPMSVGPPVVTDVPTSTEQRPRLNGTSDGEATQNDLRVSVHVADLCDVQQMEALERSTVREHKNDAPQNEWWAGIGGGLLVGAGVLAVVRPETGQSDGGLSQNEVKGTGYAAIGVGALLLAVPLIDYYRVHRVAERKVERVVVAGPFTQRDVRCGPAKDTQVTAIYPGGRELVLGRTNARGALDVDLGTATPPDWVLPKNATATLRFERGDLGTVSLATLYEQREAAAWRRAQSSECATSLDEDACAAYADYRRSFAEGEHDADARVALDDAASRRRAAAELAAWSALDLRACRTPANKKDLVAIEGACAPLAGYLTTFADGEHAEAVRAALSPGQAAIAQLQAANEQRAAASEQREAAMVASASSGGFIPYAGNGGGPTLCSDGMMSHSSGSGTCSHHGGIAGGGSSRGGGSHSGGGARSSGSHHSRRK